MYVCYSSPLQFSYVLKHAWKLPEERLTLTNHFDVLGKQTLSKLFCCRFHRRAIPPALWDLLIQKEARTALLLPYLDIGGLY